MIRRGIIDWIKNTEIFLISDLSEESENNDG